MTAIGNCPWCAGDAFPRFLCHDAYCVECSMCGVCGPIDSTEADAIAAWNRIAGLDVVIGRLRWVDGVNVAYLYLGDQTHVGQVSTINTCTWCIAIHIGTSDWRRETTGKEYLTEPEARAALEQTVRAALRGEERE